MDIGTFHYSKVAKSIPWTVISCWPVSGHISVYIHRHFTGSLLNYRTFYFLSPSRILAAAAEPVCVVILVYPAY